MKPDDEFLRELAAANDAANRMAVDAAAQGVTILLPPTQVRPNASVRMDYSDPYDAMLLAPVEVKLLSARFTCRDDWPYPVVIVDEAYKVARKPQPAHMYVLYNAARTHTAVVYGWTRNAWTLRGLRDSRSGGMRTFYVVDPQRVRFCPADQVWLTDLQEEPA